MYKFLNMFNNNSVFLDPWIVHISVTSMICAKHISNLSIISLGFNFSIYLYLNKKLLYNSIKHKIVLVVSGSQVACYWVIGHKLVSLVNLANNVENI